MVRGSAGCWPAEQTGLPSPIALPQTRDSPFRAEAANCGQSCAPHLVCPDIIAVLPSHWLDHVEELGAPLLDQPSSPICFLLGAGASLSSGGPQTEDILAICRKRRPRQFGSDEEVYEGFSERLTPGERDNIIRPLFEGFTPYAGYRCLAAMARTRPVFVVNLNWDSAVKEAADRVGADARCFDLSNVTQGKNAVAAVLKAKQGVACAHVHGILEDPNSEIRFSRSHTLALKPAELALVTKLLRMFTVIAGTSLAGPQDATQLLQALISPPSRKGGPEPLWVFERGPHANVPGFETKVAVGLSKALLARNSIDNFTCNPDVDFDLLLSAMRATVAELPWKSIVAESHDQVPQLRDLIPPNPSAVRDLLDRDRTLMVGAPRLGTTTVAYLLAWWHCLFTKPTGARTMTVKGCRGADQLLKFLDEADAPSDNVGAIVVDHLFEDDEDKGRYEAHQRLAEALERPDQRRLITIASPDATIAALCTAPPSRVKPLLEPAVLSASTLWRREDLRAWARARGGERGELVCREIRTGRVSTPSQAMRTRDGNTPFELDEKWRTRLFAHLSGVYTHESSAGLLLVLLRMQDFGVPQSEHTLERLTRTDAACLLGDPWGLCFEIFVDGQKYLRLGHGGIVEVVDRWIATGVEVLGERIDDLGEQGHWARVALSRWRAFIALEHAGHLSDKLSSGDLELYGTELVRRALQVRDPGAALDALKSTWEAVHDHWAAKDVALDLVLNWKAFELDPRAAALLDELLAADAEMGAYALFEALLRAGRPCPVELWNATTSRILNLARSAEVSESARRQVSLTFDAMLWRTCPVASEQEKQLLQRLLDVAAHNDVLNVTFAAACAYHFHGTHRLREYRLHVPTIGVELSDAQAREVAWIVEWHFAHQSRCRAMASRRNFLSTVGDPEDASAPRYLDRVTRPHALDPDHEVLIVLMAEALLRRPETAGWALHLIINVQATMGTFTVPDAQIAALNELLDNPEFMDDAVLSAAITYAPPIIIKEVMLAAIATPRGSEQLQRRLSSGVIAASSEVLEPRFSACANPWATRDRWQATPKQLPFGVGDPLALIALLDGRRREAVERGFLSEEAAERVLMTLRRGDTIAVEAVAHERKLGPEEEINLLVHASGYLEARDEQPRDSAG